MSFPLLARRPAPAPSHSPISSEEAAEARDIEAARNGDLAAFDLLVGRYQTRIYNFCLYHLSDRDEAADAAQDSFIRAFRHLKSFRGDCRFSSWLFRIALNVCHDAAKKRNLAPRTFSSLITEEETAFDPPDEEGNAPGDDLNRLERQRAVTQALAQVPEHYRAVLVLFDLQGQSYEACAEALGLPIGTVKSRLSRARAALREALEGDRELFES